MRKIEGARTFYAIMLAKQRWVFAWVAGASLAGCAPSPQAEDLRVRASYDMQCSDQRDIKVTDVGNDTYDASGCGKRATYHWVCKGHGPVAPCKWVRDPQSR